jgi:hypothetical protein
MNCFKQCLLGVVFIVIGACETTTTVDSTGTINSALSVDDLITSSYEVKTLITPDEIPYTENGALVDGNRFFFIGGNAIYEGNVQPDGSFQYEVVVETDNCQFTGLTAHDSLLYGACIVPLTTLMGMPIPKLSKLFRVDLSLDESQPQRIASTKLHGRFFAPNGMAADDRGDIFVSNSLSTIGMLLPIENLPAVIRVRVVDEENFTIKKKEVVSAGTGGLEPNGVQIKGNRLWLSGGRNLYEAEIVEKGLKNIHLIYQTGTARMFDDFAVLPDNIIAISDFALGNKPAKLRFISTGPGPYSDKAGEVIEEYKFDSSITPSSVTLMENEDGPAFYVTDYLGSGLYLMNPVIE